MRSGPQWADANSSLIVQTRGSKLEKQNYLLFFLLCRCFTLHSGSISNHNIWSMGALVGEGVAARCMPDTRGNSPTPLIYGVSDSCSDSAADTKLNVEYNACARLGDGENVQTVNLVDPKIQKV